MKPITIGQTITDRQDASLNMYLKDVSKRPMVDINEEIALAKRIQNGDKEALDKLVCANLRFVISIAKQYQNKGLPLVDLIQSGNEGLIEGAKKYDPDRGIKFISYAVWWIRQSIVRSLSDQCRTVRIPTNQIANSSKINKVLDRFEQEFGRKPSMEELGTETNIDVDKISNIMESVNRSVSLDSVNEEDDSCSLLDILPNTNSEASDNAVTNESTYKEINYVLNKLSDREGDILKMSFGIGMFPMTLEEIAFRFGVSSERIRQLQSEALDKIRKKYKNVLEGLL